MWIAIILVCILFPLFVRHQRTVSGLSSTQQITTARDIVSFRRFHVRTLEERLLIRALPNRRLVAAFGINNSFTTTEPWVHKKFVRYATRLIDRVNAHNEEWRQLSLLGQDTLRRHLLSEPVHTLGNLHQKLHLTSTVRITCFVVVLHALFPGVENIDLQAARIVTEGINRLWVQSKDATQPVSKSEQDRLGAKIRQILPTTGQGSPGCQEQDNPLDIILPAFETLWRVVLLTYVHIAFRGINSDSLGVKTEWLARDLLADLPKHLGTASAEEDAALRISKEALRLYPPTKRIHRAPSLPRAGSSSITSPPNIVVAADIESLHRDGLIWGRNGRDFDLERMGGWLTEPQTLAYMPFGLAPHLCPAANRFGERMIAMLLRVLFRGLGTRESGTRIAYGDAELDGDLYTPLPTGRQDAEGWHVFLNSAAE